MTEATETKSKPRAVMLTDDEYERILKQADRWGLGYSSFMRMIALQLCEREENKNG
jgi:hypothetical protein